MNNTELYIEKYIELEHTVKEVYGLKESDSIYYYLNRQEKYQVYKEKIAYCQKVRNFLHHEYKIEEEFAITPSDEMIEFITELIKEIRNQSRCKDIMIKSIYYQTLEGNVYDTLKIMREKDYSHVPIIHQSKVIGVFNKLNLLNIFDTLDQNMIFKDIEYLLNVEPKHYIFISDDLLIEDLQNLFISNYKNGRRIDLLLVTESGKETAELIGIVTPWLILQQ